MRSRRWLAGLTLVLAAPLLAACSPSLDGLAGVTVDDAGLPIGVVASCDTSMDGANLYRLGLAIDPDTRRTKIAEWSLSSDTTEAPVTWSMTGGDTESTSVVAPLAEWPVDSQLNLTAWGDNHNVSAHLDVTFSAADLSRIQPGTVLIGSLVSSTGRSVTMAEFTRLACADPGQLRIGTTAVTSAS